MREVNAPNYRREKNVFSNLFLFLLIILIIPLTNALTENTEASYSFENFPSTQAYDYSENDKDLELTLSSVMSNTFAKIDNWGVKTNSTGGEYLYLNNNNTSVFNVSVNSNMSISFWYYTDNVPVLTPLITFGKDQEIMFVPILYSNGSNIGTYIIHTTNSAESCNNFYITGVANSTLKNSYNHVVYDYARTATDTFTVKIYLNGDLILSNTPTPSGSWTDFGGESVVKIGINPTGTGCGTIFTTAPNATVYFDQVDIFNKSLTQSDVNILYADGDGIDIFDAGLPEQVASIAPIDMVFLSNTERDFGAYFNKETYVEMRFDYSNATNYLNYSTTDTASFSTFAIQFTSATEASFWSFNNILPSLTLEVRACNTNGCSDWVEVLFSIGYEGSGAYQIASVAPVSMAQQSTKFLTFSDFFLQYTDTYFQYTDPDNASTQLIGDGQSISNTCFNATISGDNLILNSNSQVCTVNEVYLLVDDGQTLVQSNEFSISVYGGNGTGAGGLIVSSFNNWFPNSETLSPRAKMAYVLITMGITLLVGLFVIWNSQNSQFVGIGVGAVLVIEFVYFTTINYIPILWVALFGVVVAIGGIALFTRKTTGET